MRLIGEAGGYGQICQACRGNGLGRPQDRLMTQVDTVEESDRCDGWFLDEWERPDPADHVHGRRAYTPCAPVPPRGTLGKLDRWRTR